MTPSRPVPVPDDSSSAYWSAAARHVLTVARCAHCGTLTMPPDVMCAACGSTEPGYEFVPVSGDGVIRSWTVIRQSFIPGFDLPFALVDVELVEQAGLRLIARLIGEGDPTPGAAVHVVFEDIDGEIAVPAFELTP